ncbi:MAG: hypothetical protein JWL90_564 [Chthoniobacteraceae bacterium]|nr:hypothetical protein [Chthoniobacteraceae bacterium]
MGLKEKLSQLHDERSVIRQVHGFAMVEVLVAATLIGVAAIASIQGLGVLNRNAAGVRSLTNARAVLERNINTTLSVPWNAGSVPAVLAFTSPAGAVYDDDAGTPFDNGTANTVSLALQGTNGIQLINGTLTRIVTAVPNTDNADIRQVTFRVNYNYRGRSYSCELTTMRAIDD